MKLKLIVVNLLTLIRIIGTIILIPLYKIFNGKIVGIISFFCYFTDSIDGILARKWHVSTFFGAIFDGFSDKLFTIINFIILYLITPYALIPIIIEILIVLVQTFKYNHNLNVQSNIIGKSKVWILAITVVLTFFCSDIESISIISIEFKNYILNIPNKTLYLYLLMPAIIMEILTLFSYIFEICFPKNIEILVEKNKKIEMPKLNLEERKEYIKNVWLNPEFYEKHKDDTNLKDLRKLSKEISR